MKILKVIFLTAVFGLHSSSGFTQDHAYKLLESFEESIPETLKTTGKVSLDTNRMKYGNSSLKWEWKGNDQIILNRHLGYHQQEFIKDTEQLQNGHGGSEKNPVLEPPRGFFVWIYNEKSSQQRIRFQFGRGDKVDCEFDFNLNFKGWRSCAIGYDRGDMRGTPHLQMNRLTINAPATGSGSFYFDMLGTSVATNPRTVNPNPQLPEIDQHPRLVAQYPHLLFEFSKYRPTFNLEPLNEQTLADFRTLEKKVMDIIFPVYDQKRISGNKMEGLKKRFASFNIRREGEKIYGAPLQNNNIFKDYFPEFPGTKVDIHKGVKNWRQDLGSLLKDLAFTYTVVESQKIKDECTAMFLDLFDYAIDQGFDYGAGLGWIHHYSYIIREYAPAFYLMKDVLKEHQKLDKAIEVSKWFYGFNQCYREDLVYNCEGRKAGNADEIQGFLVLKLVCALMMEDSPEKARDIKHYSSYYSNVFTAYSNALDETYKPDGTFFHHAGHAFGYGGRAVYGGVSAGYALSGTQFAQTRESYQRMRKVTENLMYCLFTDKLMAPKAFASIRFSNYDLPSQFYQLPAVLACSSEDFDDEMGALYKDLLSKKGGDLSEDHLFWMNKVKARQNNDKPYIYSKSKQLPYSCVTLKRNADEWMVAYRGHSKYVYPFESWGSSFFAYPLFVANGYLDVSYPESLDSQTPEKGTWHLGYDWHRWPGATSIYLPYDEMQTNPGQVRDEGGEYLFSDQAFSGGVETSYGAAVSAFQFKGHDKFGLQGFTGKKSYFFFDDKVICLGSNINSDLDYAVETTLFQTALAKKSDAIILKDEGPVTEFPFSKEGALKSSWIIDTRGTGYFMMDKNKVKMEKSTQTNPDFKGKDDVSGDFASAYICHGKTTTDASYQYIMMPAANEDKMDNMGAEMKTHNAPIKVIQSDSLAHVIEYKPDNTYGYAVYALNGTRFKDGPVKGVSKQSTFVIKEDQGKLIVSIADPDLNIYDGQDDLLPDGVRCELSIYEREWFFWPSRSSKVRISIKGDWAIEKQIMEMETAEEKNAKLISSSKGETVIEFECRDGLSAEVMLMPGK